MNPPLSIPGVQLLPLTPHTCVRGTVTEMFRQTWRDDLTFPQWNLTHSEVQTFRGMHVHRRRVDYICVAQGTLVAGLYDARSDSPTCGQSCLLTLDGQQPRALIIPTGVVHGFFFPVSTIYLHGMTTPWDGTDELRSNWTDPAFGLDWPMSAPIVSDQDRHAPPLAETLAALRPLTTASA